MKKILIDSVRKLKGILLYFPCFFEFFIDKIT